MPSEFAWAPDYGDTQEEKPEVIESKFGDNYSQVVPKGINNLTQTFKYTFTQPVATAQAILAFLRTKGAVTPSTFTPPGEGEIKVRCMGWSATRENFGFRKVTAEFVRFYG